MTVTAFFTNRSGVGKTTASCNVANAISRLGRSVLLIDADPQCSASVLTLGAGYLEIGGVETLEDLLMPVISGDGHLREIAPTRSDAFGISVIPCHPAVSISEDLLAGDWGRAKAGDFRAASTTLLIRSLIEKVGPSYDDVIIDCGPTFGHLTRSCLLASDRFVSPLGNDAFSAHALKNAETWFMRLRSDLDDIGRVLDLDGKLSAIQNVSAPSFRGVITTGKGHVLSGEMRAAARSLAIFTRGDICEDVHIGDVYSAGQTAMKAMKAGMPMRDLSTEAGTSYDAIASTLVGKS